MKKNDIKGATISQDSLKDGVKQAMCSQRNHSHHHEPIWSRNQYLSSISQPHHFSELVFQVSNCSHCSLILCQ